MNVVKAAQLSGRTLEKVVVQPLVLLSIVDQYNRVARDTRKRVGGVLLGTSSRGIIDVTNSYAVPFQEDDKDPRIWFLDHNYHESMFSMFKRINAKEHVVGWYSTGPKLKENDLDVHALFTKFVKRPIWCCERRGLSMEKIPRRAPQDCFQRGKKLRELQLNRRIIHDFIVVKEGKLSHLENLPIRGSNEDIVRTIVKITQLP
nr:26S proteasome non-ATPase regulatory subunit 7 homolog A-like [Aegilops tauschii subsp. strangulata]